MCDVRRSHPAYRVADQTAVLGHPQGSRGDPTDPDFSVYHPDGLHPGRRVGNRPGGLVTYSARPAVRLVRPAGRVVRLNGVGFKSFRRADWLVFQLGYSHYVVTRVTGLARPRRGALAVGDPAGLTHLRRPDPYKARGVYADGDRPTLKEGKRR